MRVIHYIPSIDRSYGGVGVYMQLLAKELGRVVDLHIVTIKSDNELIIPNSTIHYISPSILGSSKRQWITLLNRLRADVVHINCCWTPQCSLFQKWAQELGYRVVLTPHGMLEPWIIKRNFWIKKLPALILYQRRAIARADVIHATSHSERENILKLGYNSNVSVVPIGVDVNSIELKSSVDNIDSKSNVDSLNVDSLNLKSDSSKSKKILFLSRLHPKKGVELLIGAASQLRTKLDGYEFIVAGEGEATYIAKLKSMTKSLEVDRMFSFCGGVYDDAKWQLFRQADIFVLPTYSENFGIVVAESLASGTPVITTTATPWSQIGESHCGWCVAPTQEAITGAIDRAIATSDQTLARMGAQGRQLIEREYSTLSMAQTMKEIYEMLSLMV